MTFRGVEMIHLKIPATSANLGAGFDCLGMALDMYNEITIETIEQGLEIIVPEQDRLLVESDQTNLVYRTMKQVADLTGNILPGLRMIQSNGIPITRGLGSSAACIVGGVVAANLLLGKPLSQQEIITLTTEMDGHPDNVLPAMVGGMTVACLEGRKVHYVRIEPPSPIKFAVMIPNFPLSTSLARKILPESVSMKDAVFNIGRASLFIASLLTGNFSNLWTATEDRLHQPYRKKFIPHWDEIIFNVRKLGAKGVFLSGAGPTIIALLDHDYQIFQHEMAYLASAFDEKWEVRIVDICYNGVEVINL